MLQLFESNLSSTLRTQHKVLVSQMINEKATNPSQVQELLYQKFRSQPDQYDLLMSTVIQNNNTLLITFASFKQLSLQKNIVSLRFSDISLVHPDIKEISILAIYDLHTSFQDIIRPFMSSSRPKSKRYSNKSQIISLRSNLNNTDAQIEPRAISKSKKDPDCQSSMTRRTQVINNKKNQPLEKKCSFSKPVNSVLTSYPAMRAKLSEAKSQAQVAKQQQSSLKTSTPASAKKMTLDSDEQPYNQQTFAKMMEIEENKVSVPSSKIQGESDSDDDDADIFAKMQQAKQTVAAKQPVDKPSTPIASKELKLTQKTSQTSITNWFGRA